MAIDELQSITGAATFKKTFYCTKKRLEAGLRPKLLEELKRSQTP